MSDDLVRLEGGSFDGRIGRAPAGIASTLRLGATLDGEKWSELYMRKGDAVDGDGRPVLLFSRRDAEA